MKSIQGGTVPALIWRDVMKVATEPYGKVDFNYPEIELTAFQAKPGSIKIIKQEEDKKEEENSETQNQVPEATTPAEVLQNFKNSRHSSTQFSLYMHQLQPLHRSRQHSLHQYQFRWQYRRVCTNDRRNFCNTYWR